MLNRSVVGHNNQPPATAAGLTAGVLGCSLPSLLANAESQAKSVRPSGVRARNVLLIYEEGGISQMDSWDPKPDALLVHRSPFAPTATKVPGIHYSSLPPQVSQHADKLAVVRSMTSTTAAGHVEGCLEFFKGYRSGSPAFRGADHRTHRFPDIGSVVTESLGTECRQLPGYVLSPGANLPHHAGNPGFLGSGRAPWKLGTKSQEENPADRDWRVRSLDPQPGMNAERMSVRSADRR